MSTIPTYFETPAGYYRIMSGYHLQSEREAVRIAEDHVERTGQAVAFVRRPMAFREGASVHVYAKAS